MDKLADMALFVAIVKQQGLAAAGRELGLSPATVTARLQALEERYGVKLLNRTTRHISLTDSGALYHQSCLQILDSVKETENLLQTGNKEVRGTLKISAPRDIGKQLIAPLLSKFCARHPQVTPYLYLNDNLSNMAESGLDIVIRYGELADSNLISRRLTTSQRVLCASPSYVAKRGAPSTPQELTNHDCLALVRGSEELKTWHFQLGKQHSAITIAPKRCSDDGEIIRQWALDGAGIALKSILDVAQDIEQGRLVTLLDDYSKNFTATAPLAGADLNLIYQSRQYQPKRLQLFIDFLLEHFKRQS